MIKAFVLVAAATVLLPCAASAAHQHHRQAAVRDIGRKASQAGWGDVIVSGRTGMHRSGLAMVRDEPGTGDPDAAGSVGANGSVGLYANGR